MGCYRSNMMSTNRFSDPHFAQVIHWNFSYVSYTVRNLIKRILVWHASPHLGSKSRSFVKFTSLECRNETIYILTISWADSIICRLSSNLVWWLSSRTYSTTASQVWWQQVKGFQIFGVVFFHFLIGKVSHPKLCSHCQLSCSKYWLYYKFMQFVVGLCTYRWMTTRETVIDASENHVAYWAKVPLKEH
jgi:hypothetical protein